MLVLLNVATPGSLVKKGEVVAEFDRQYQVLRLDDYRAQIVQRDANIKKLKADQAVYRNSHEQLLKVARADLNKATLDLKTIEVVSAIDAETLKLAAEEADARLKQIQAEVKLVEDQLAAQLKANEIDRNQAVIELKRAEANLDRMLLKAPIDGIVVMQTIFRGGEFGQVQQGDMLHPGQYFMQIVDPGSMVLNASVNQVDSEALRIGMKAVAHVDAYPGLDLPAHVYGIGAMTRPGMWRPNYMRELPVKLKLDKFDLRIIPDLSASADVLLESEQKAVLAPLGSIFRDSESSTPYVLLRRPEGFERREVELGLKSNVYAAVRAGLQPGDAIAAQRLPMGERK